MRWMKWTVVASVALLPVFALADEPADKSKKPDESPKIGLRIEVQLDGDKPHVLVLGDGGSKESKQAAKVAQETIKRHVIVIGEGKESKEAPDEIQVQLKQLEAALKKAQHDKKPQQDGIIFKEAREGHEARERHERREGEVERFNITVPFNPRQHEMKKGGYLGISTDAPPAVLSKHLGLQEGFGLVVDQVMHESPAAKAGLQKFDVIQKVDDQLVINMEQLSVLIHSHKAGDEVKLAIIHEGKPAVLTAKLIEHEYAAVSDARESEKVEDLVLRMLPQPGGRWQVMPAAQGGLVPGEGKAGAQMNRAKLAPLGGGGVLGQPRPTSKTLIEGDHTYTLTVSPWGHKVYVVTEKGKPLFDGPVNSPEQREKVPADMADMLKKLEKEVMPKIINNLPPGASLPLNPAPKAAQNPAPNAAQVPAQNPAQKKKADKDSDAK